MRFHEIMGGIKIPVYNEEQMILDKIGDDSIANSELNEREQEVARKMVSRGLLNRFVSDGEILFYANFDPSLRRI